MKQQNENGFKRIEVETSRDGVHTVKKAFMGRILVDLDVGDRSNPGGRYQVFRTAGGMLAVYCQNSCAKFPNVTERRWLMVYDSFWALRENNGEEWNLPSEVIAAVAAEVGEPHKPYDVEELDI